MEAEGDGLRRKALEMIRRAYHEDAVVVIQSVDLIQEVGADFVVDETVEIFEYKHARRHHPCFREDLANTCDMEA